MFVRPDVCRMCMTTPSSASFFVTATKGVRATFRLQTHPSFRDSLISFANSIKSSRPYLVSSNSVSIRNSREAHRSMPSERSGSKGMATGGLQNRYLHSPDRTDLRYSTCRLRHVCKGSGGFLGSRRKYLSHPIATSCSNVSFCPVSLLYPKLGSHINFANTFSHNQRAIVTLAILMSMLKHNGSSVTGTTLCQFPGGT